MKPLFYTTMMAGLMLSTSAYADRLYYLGDNYVVEAPDQCKAKDGALECGERLIIEFDKDVSRGVLYTQAHQLDIANDPVKSRKSINAMEIRLVQFVKAHKSTVSRVPEVEFQRIGNFIAVVGAVHDDGGIYIAKAQLWDNGHGAEITGIAGDSTSKAIFWNIVNTFRNRWLGEN